MLDPAPLVIHCDESGFAGGNLVGAGHSPIFVHASLRIEPVTAAGAVARFRAGVGAHGGEYRSAELMRGRHRPVLLELLAPGGPLTGRCRIHLIDTRWFTLARLADVLLGRPPVRAVESPGREPATRALATVLHTGGPDAYGPVAWPAFLGAAGGLLRTRKRWSAAQALDSLFDALDALGRIPAPPAVAAAVHRLSTTRPAAAAWREQQLRRPRPTPLVEPLIPALMRAVVAWGRTSPRIEVVHDEQSVLTPRRMTELALAYAQEHPGHELIGVRRVDSREDVRIQLADLVAGAALRLTRNALAGHPDDEALTLLDPLVDEESLWPAGLGAVVDRPALRAGR